METTTTVTDRRRAELPRRVTCLACGDTGTVWTMERKVIRHMRDGLHVYSAHKALTGRVCACRAGWNQKIGADA